MNASDGLAEDIQLLRLIDKTSSTMMTPPPSEEKAPLSSQKSTSNHSDDTTKHHADGDKTDYIESLKQEREQLVQFADGFNHVFTLIDKEIKRVSGDEEKTSGTLAEVILVPVEQYPTYNFVGRILGPRGTTAKQLEVSTGCKVTILGRNKSVTGAGESSQSSTDNGPLRVQISCPSDVPNAEERMKSGVEVIKALLIPPADGQDELKRQQLMVLANMNGTYRPRLTVATHSQNQSQNHNASGDYGNQFQNLLPFGYRLPMWSKSQHDVNSEQAHACHNPKCTDLRNLVQKNSIPKIEDVLSVMHMYEAMNRMRLANSSLFGEPRHYDEMLKAQEIGNRMCSSIGSLGGRSTSTGVQTSPQQRRTYKPRTAGKK